MRILVAGTTYYPAINGQASFTVNLAEGLARRGHEVLVITQSNQGRPYRQEQNGVQIQAIRAISLNIWYPGAYFSPFPGRPVQQVFNEFQPDIVHIQDHYPLSYYVFKLAHQHNLRVIGTNHFMPENLAPYLLSFAWFKTGFNWALWRWMLDLFNRLDVVTAPSKTAAAILRHQGLQPPVYPVSCGVDLNRFYPDGGADRKALRQRFGLDPDSVVFLFVGRVDAEKRVDVLLRALKILGRQDIQLAITGHGAALGGVKKLAQELNIERHVRFTGFVPQEDLHALLNSVDVFTMPSEAELLSIATLEAMASSLPVLAANAQALPELVDEGRNGYLFQPGNPGDAARLMALLAGQKNGWEKMRCASLEKVQPHSLENTLKRYEEIYENILIGAPKPHFHSGSTWGRPVKKYIKKTMVDLWE